MLFATEVGEHSLEPTLRSGDSHSCCTSKSSSACIDEIPGDSKTEIMIMTKISFNENIDVVNKQCRF